MLQELRVNNLALIDTLQLDCTGTTAGLTVLTGETGAGKSIILQAIHLLVGMRGSASWVRSGCDQAVIEACFEVQPHHREVNEILTDHGLKEGNLCIIRRILTNKGRTRMYVNDRLVTSRLSGEITENLVNIASQHDHQQLLNTRRHIDFLDSYGELWNMRERFGLEFKRWQQVSSSLRQLQDRELDKEQKRDFLSFQVEEITNASLESGEDEKLIKERDRLKFSTNLAELIGKSHALIKTNIIDSFFEIRKNIEQAATLDPDLEEMAERISSTSFEVEDIEDGLRSYRESIPMDSARLDEISTRLAELKQLQRKYGLTLEEVIAHGEKAAGELASFENLEQQVEELEHELERVSTEALLTATGLSSARKEVAAKFARAMESELASLNFLEARFEVRVTEPEGLGLQGIQSSGKDLVEFLFSANPGEPPKPLGKVVSGGELSRLMLAMKCLLARRDHIDTVIFDEVDAGISGQAAEAVADKIIELAGHHQVFCITHLPQIAAHADAHYKVEKDVIDDRTTTLIQPLRQEDRIAELARMLGGEQPTEQTLMYAKDLVERKGNKVPT